MSGIAEHNFPAFNAAAKAWRTAGWDVYNPAEQFDGDVTQPYSVYVKHDIAVLRRCDALAVLPDWADDGARGSVWEYWIARELLGLTVYNADTPINAKLVIDETFI